MSILIKGMDMPKDGAIKLFLWPDGQVDKLADDIMECRQYNAIEVPTPHGDLIDRDKLNIYFQLVNDFGDVVGVRHAVSINEIEEAPAIIESEY